MAQIEVKKIKHKIKATSFCQNLHHNYERKVSLNRKMNDIDSLRREREEVEGNSRNVEQLVGNSRKFPMFPSAFTLCFTHKMLIIFPQAPIISVRLFALFIFVHNFSR
jgi:hypothetical protein